MPDESKSKVARHGGPMMHFKEIDFEAVSRWHARAVDLRKQGMSIRQICCAVDRSFSAVQRLLNPVSKKKIQKRHNERIKERQVESSEFRDDLSEYRRAYMSAWFKLQRSRSRQCRDEVKA